MADLVPDVTNITGSVSTYDAAGILAALYTHFNGTSTKWSVDFANTTTNTGDEGITLSPVAVGEVFQVNLRNNGGNNIEVSIEPADSITDPGDSTPTSPTGTGADWSGEGTWNVTATDIGSIGAGSKVYVVETDDHFAVFIGNSAMATHSANGISVGRIYQPWNQNAINAGQDGLGMMVGKPDGGGTSGGSGDWSATTPQQSKIHYETNRWGSAYTFNLFDSTQADGIDGETFILPTPAMCMCDIGSNIPCVGPYKYHRIVGTFNTAKSIIPVTSSNQGWVYIDSSTANVYGTYIWDKTVTP